MGSLVYASGDDVAATTAFGAKTSGLVAVFEGIEAGMFVESGEVPGTGSGAATSKNIPGDDEPLPREPELLPEEPASQLPGVAGEELLISPPYSTSGPGCGKTGSSFSVVVQEVTPLTLATQIFGRLSKLPEEAPSIVTHAQFM
jgi:hypothetical protein